MIKCIWMVVAMWNGAPDMRCVPAATCGYLDAQVLLGRVVTVTRGEGPSKYTTVIKDVYCYTSETGEYAEK